MKKLKISFSSDEIEAVKEVIDVITRILNTDNIINYGLNKDEWLVLKKLLEIKTIIINDRKGNLIPVQSESIIKKIDVVVRKADRENPDI